MTRPHRMKAASAMLAALLVAGCSAGQSASPTGSPIVSESVLPSPGVAACPAGGHITAGTWAFSAKDTQTVPATITVPGGWDGCGLLFKEFGEPAGPALIAFWSVANVYADPCRWGTTLMDPAVGPAVDDLATALVDQALTDSSTPTDVTLGGFSGSYLRLSVPLDTDVTSCERVNEAEFRFFNGPGESVWWLGAKDAPGLIGEVWILDVGGARMVITAAYFSDAAAPEIDEIHQIVGSITPEP